MDAPTALHIEKVKRALYNEIIQFCLDWEIGTVHSKEELVERLKENSRARGYELIDPHWVDDTTIAAMVSVPISQIHFSGVLRT